MVSVCIEINTTRDIGRQILRHKSFGYQEFSQRYAEKGEPFPSDDYRELRLQDLKNRQNSLETDNAMLASNWLACQIKVEQMCLEQYNWAIKAGIAKEVARCILPEGLTMSRMYMAGTLRSWIHYCILRMSNGTQKEHRDIAKKCWTILCDEFEFLRDIEVEGNNNV
jgi:thymidylate synthase (FAD)